MAKQKGTEAAELYILFNVMNPSEISNIFPEYRKNVRVYYMRWVQAKKSVEQKLTIKEISKRVFFGAERT